MTSPNVIGGSSIDVGTCFCDNRNLTNENQPTLTESPSVFTSDLVVKSELEILKVQRNSPTCLYRMSLCSWFDWHYVAKFYSCITLYLILFKNKDYLTWFFLELLSVVHFKCISHWIACKSYLNIHKNQDIRIYLSIPSTWVDISYLKSKFQQIIKSLLMDYLEISSYLYFFIYDWYINSTRFTSLTWQNIVLINLSYRDSPWVVFLLIVLLINIYIYIYNLIKFSLYIFRNKFTWRI